MVGLTDEQQAAVSHRDGPCLVIAGAGTGKTRVLTQRVAYLIEQKIARPDEIVALTFTDKAATEMQERVDELLPLGTNTANISTFHSFTNELLRQYAHLLGIHADFTLLTSEEEIVFLHDHLWELPLKQLRPSNNPNKFLKDIAAFFGTLNDEAISSERLNAWADQYLGSEEAGERDRAAIMAELAAARAKYDELLRENGYLTFGHCISEVLRLLDEHPSVTDELTRRYRYILVDEYQDTNWAQTELATRLAGKSGNLMVVGDDDQAIYSFRGAAVGNLIDFRRRWPDCQIIVLTRNFRSTQSILDASYRSIQANNPHRLEYAEKIDKRLVSPQVGESPRFNYYATRSGELAGVAEQVQAWLTDGIPAQEIAVLCRAGSQARQVEEALRRAGVAVASHQQDSLFDLPLIKGVLAFLRLLVRQDDNVAAHEVFTHPPFRLPGSIWQRVCESRDYNEDSLLRAAQTVRQEQPRWLGESGAKLSRTLDLLDALAGTAAQPASSVFLKMIHQSGLYERLAKSQRPAAERSLTHLGQLFDEMQAYEERHRRADLASWLRYLDVLIDIGQDVPAAESEQDDPFAVNVMTIHKSKGLEFTAVIVPFCAVGKFPGRNMTRPLNLPSELARIASEEEVAQAEERRLFYVALTRAREHLVCTAAERYSASQRSKPSPFIVEAFPDVDWSKLTAQVVPPADFLQSTLDLPSSDTLPPAPANLFEQKKVSYSQLSTYLECPWRYKLAYVLRVRTYPSHALSFGNSMHETLRAYFDARRRGETPDVAELLKKYWRRGGYETRAQETQKLAEGVQALREMEEALKTAQPVALELPFEFPLPNGQRVTGRIDRLDQTAAGEVIIIDYKTGKAKSEKEATRDLQLGIYILAVEQARRQTVAEVRLNYVMDHVELSVPKDKFALAEVTEKVTKTAEQLAADRRTGEFKPTPSQQACGYCDYRNICPFRYNN